MARTESTVPAPESPAEILNRRALRGLALFEEHGHLIRHVAGDVFRVPSQDGERSSYDVRYGEVEECPCGDHQYRHLTCCHLYAVGILHAKRHIIPAAGDPFVHAGKRRKCSACFAGYATITVEHDGEERDEPVRCHRCAAGEAHGVL